MTLARTIENLQRKTESGAATKSRAAENQAMAKRSEKHKTPRGICRVCGCVDEQACEGGCEWTDQMRSLCSACVDLTPDEIAAKRAAAAEALVTQHLMVVAELEGLADDLSNIMARLEVIRAPILD